MKQYTIILLLVLAVFSCQKSELYDYPDTASSSTVIKSITLFDGEKNVSKVAEIDSLKNTIVVSVDSAVNLKRLAPRVVVPDGVTINPSMGVYADFSSPQIYTVISGDKTAQRDWVISVVYSLGRFN